MLRESFTAVLPEGFHFWAYELANDIRTRGQALLDILFSPKAEKPVPESPEPTEPLSDSRTIFFPKEATEEWVQAYIIIDRLDRDVKRLSQEQQLSPGIKQQRVFLPKSSPGWINVYKNKELTELLAEAEKFDPNSANMAKMLALLSVCKEMLEFKNFLQYSQGLVTTSVQKAPLRLA